VDTISMPMDVVGDWTVTTQGCGQHEAYLPLLNHVRSAIPLSGLGSGVGHERHAEGSAVEVRRLPGVADVELNVIGSLQRKKIGVCA